MKHMSVLPTITIEVDMLTQRIVRSRRNVRMGKSSRRKKERRKSGPKSPLGLELTGMTSPLADLPRRELAGMMAKFGKNQAEKFASSTIAIGDLMSRVDPLHL